MLKTITLVFLLAVQGSSGRSIQESEIIACGDHDNVARAEPVVPIPIRNPLLDPRCPSEEPTLNQDCHVPEGVFCEYVLYECCGKKIARTTFVCYGTWSAMVSDMNCGKF